MIVTSSVSDADADPGESRRRMRRQIRQTKARESGFEANSQRSGTRSPKPEKHPNNWEFNGLCRIGVIQKRVGVTDYTYRDYEPLTGRWPSRDPIKENGGINLYGFIENNAIFTVDVKGRRPLDNGDARRAADSACRIAMSHYNRGNFYSMPTGAVSGVTNTAGAQIAGLGYYAGIREAGVNATQRAESLMDAYTSSIQSACDELTYPDPEPPSPSPSPQPGGYANCDYSCGQLATGEALGQRACLYGNCTLTQKTGGSADVDCPYNLPGTITLLAQKDEDGCSYCDDPITESRTYEAGEPLEDQTYDGFTYSRW